MVDAERTISRKIKLNPRLFTTELALERHHRREGCKQGIAERIAEAIEVFDPKLMKAFAIGRKTTENPQG